MNSTEFKRFVSMDLHRYAGRVSIAAFIQTFASEPGFRITALMRMCALLRSQPLTRVGLYHLFRFWFQQCSIRFGVYLDFTTRIGGGLFIPHPFSIVVNRRTIIGENCNLAQNVTIGIANRGRRKGTPTIGNRVFIGPGSVISGNVTIGDRCAVGANCVVTRDAAPGSVIAGVPGKIISELGSDGYINSILGEPDSSDEGD